MVLYSESGSNLLLWSFDLLSLNLFWEISRKIVVVDINKDRLFKKPYLLILAFRDSNKQDRVMSFSCLLRAELTTGYGTNTVVFVKVQFSLSVVSDSATPWTTARQASLSITSSWSPAKPMSIELVMPSNHLILCRPLLPPSIFPSIRVFSNESALHIRWPKYWSFFSASTSALPMNTQDLSPLGWTGWISLQFKGLSRVFSNTTVQKHQFFGTQLSL